MSILAIIHIELRKYISSDVSVIVSARFDPDIDDKKQICNTVNDLFNNSGFLPPQNETQAHERNVI